MSYKKGRSNTPYKGNSAKKVPGPIVDQSALVDPQFRPKHRVKKAKRE